MALQESGEMYLETILILSKEKDMVRSIDVGTALGYSKPSVSRAMGILKNDNYITVDRSGEIRLTDEGRAIAEKIYDRHQVLAEVLMMLGVPKETAVEDACKMEHDISDVTFNAIKLHMQNK